MRTFVVANNTQTTIYNRINVWCDLKILSFEGKSHFLLTAAFKAVCEGKISIILGIRTKHIVVH